MRSARHALTSRAKSSLLSGDIERMRVAMSLEMLVTLGITALAMGMAVGYQVLRLLGSRSAVSH